MLHRIALSAAAVFVMSISLGCANKDNDRYYWQHDPGASYKTFRTYALEQNVEPFFAAREQDGGVKLRPVIEQEIEGQMAAKGFTRAEPGRQADLVVRYFGGLEETAIVRPGAAPPVREMGRTRSAPPSVYVPLPPSGRRDAPPERAEGRLVVEVVDPRTGRGLWRGTADQTLGEQNVSEQRVRDTVAALMKRFPPPDDK
jgi:hypothetical protein